MPDLVALFDSVGYKSEAGDTLYAAKGETFTASDAEAARLKAAGAVADPKSDEAKEVVALSPDAGREHPVGSAPAEELGKLKVDELREHAKAAGVYDVEQMTKAELVAAIQAAGAIG